MMLGSAPEVGQGGWPRAAGSSGFRLVMGQPERRARTGSAMSQQDETLREGLARDLDGTFESLVRAYQDRLYSFALRVTRNAQDAEEVAQDAFVRAYRALASYGEERVRALALRAWLYRITLNVARNRLRGKKPKLVSLDHPHPAGESGDGRSVWEPADDPSGRPDALYEQGRRRADLATLVGRLPKRYREALVLRYVEGLQLDEVARVLGQPLGTAKSNVHRGIVALREALSRSRAAGPQGVRK
ncbi:MAG TPA: sigma-70 family RNA polymerase sigma factor [Thermoanaerobaculia bacterium]|jgi:RNA polymerase sigma-70 factor (ECF subfamily)